MSAIRRLVRLTALPLGIALIASLATSATPAAAAGPAVSANPGSFDFGTLTVGGPGTSQSFVLTNTGTADLHLQGVSLTGANPSDFRLSLDGCSYRTVAAGSTCTEAAAFAPKEAGALSANLTFVDDAADSPQNIPLTGHGTGPVVAFAPANLNFDRDPLGQQTAPQTFYVKNTGDSPLTMSSATPLNNAALGTLVIVADGCSGQTLAAGGNCPMQVAFIATQAVSGSLDLRFTTNVPPGWQDYVMFASGLGPLAQTYNPSNFNNQPQNSISQPQYVQLQNAGSVPLHVSTVAMSGAGASQFIVTSDGCSNTTVDPGDQCKVFLEFAPTGTGQITALMTFNDDAPGGAQSATVFGRAIAPGAVISPSSIDYGVIVDGGGTASQTVQLSNPTSQALPVTSASVTAGSGVFSLTADSCSGITVAAGSSCSVTVQFAPAFQSAGFTGTITFNDAAGSQQVPLAGSGVDPQMTYSPESIDFGNQRAAASSTTRPLTITNTSANALTPQFSTTTGGGNVGGAFSINGSGCTQPLAPGASCQLLVTFTPTGLGLVTGTVAIANPVTNSISQIPISGMGIAPNVPTITAIPFDDQRVNTTSSNWTLEFVNSGTDTMHISSVTVSGPNASAFALAAPSCAGVALVPSSACLIHVNFTPTAPGAYSAFLNVADDAWNGSSQFTLKGNGVASHSTFTPSPVSFPQTIAGQSASQTVNLTSNGTASLNIGAISVTGQGASAYSVSANTCTGLQLPATIGCSVTVTFTPPSAGTFAASLSVADDATLSPETVALSGNGIQAHATITPNPVSFGGLRPGTTASPQTVSLTNDGNAAVQVSSVAISGDPSFSLSGDTCSGTSLAIGAVCTVAVGFTPTAVGSDSATLTFTDDALNSPQSVALSGSGVAPGVSLSSSSVSFGNVLVGTTSASQVVTITNSGTDTLHVGTATVTGSFAAGTDGCSNSTLAPAATCTIQLTFTPVATGPAGGTLSISDDASTSPQSVALTGTGVQPQGSVSPASLSFGNVLVGPGNAAAQQFVTISNTGTADLHVASFTLSGNPAFTLGAECRPWTIAPGASCQVGVYASPDAVGLRTGSLVITDDAPGGSQSVALTVTGVEPQALVSPASLSFGNVLVGPGNAASQLYVTISNTGTSDLHVASVTLSGNPAFTIGTGCTPATIAPGASCQVGVYASPDVVGVRTGSLLITDDAPGGSQSVALTVTGVQPQAAVSPSTLSFGNVLVGPGNAASQLYVTISNTGTADLHVASVTLSGNLAFTIGTGCTSTTIAPGASCQVGVYASPDVVGARVASLVITDDAPGGSQSVALTVTGIQPQASVSPASLSFGSVHVGPGSPAAQQFVTVTSTGTATLHISSVTLTGDAAFTIGTACSSTTLAPGASCRVGIYASPDTIGARSGSLVVADDAPGGRQTVALSVTGLDGRLGTNPTSINFGSLKVNSTSPKFTVTVTNTGNATLTLGQVTITGPNASSFKIASNNCNGAKLAPGATCVVTVTFKPLLVGQLAASLTFANDGLGGTQSVALTGTGTK